MRQPRRPTGPQVFERGEIDSTSVTLRFFGEDLDPDDVTRMLGAKPTLSRRMGEVINDVTPRTAETGSWLLSSERQSHSALETQIESLFERLTEDLEVWKRLSAQYRGDLFCGLWSESWNRGLALSSTVLNRIAQRGLRVGFDIYFVDEPKQPQPS